MAGVGRDPSPHELLDRIERLERENSSLRAQLDDVQKGLSIFMAATEDSLAHVNDLLWPVADKVFPHLREMKSRMDAVVPPCFVDPRADRRREDKTS